MSVLMYYLHLQTFLVICLLMDEGFTTNSNVRARYPLLIMCSNNIPLKMTPKPKGVRHAVPERGGLNNLNNGYARKKPISTRYQSVFGPSKPIKGSEFVPQNIDNYTGKLTTSRRQTFKWRPTGEITNYFMFTKHQ